MLFACAGSLLAYLAQVPLARDHWDAIENGVHSLRDEVFGADRSTIFRGQTPQNLAALRNTALNWLRQAGYDKFAPTLTQFRTESLAPLHQTRLHELSESPGRSADGSRRKAEGRKRKAAAVSSWRKSRWL